MRNRPGHNCFEEKCALLAVLKRITTLADVSPCLEELCSALREHRSFDLLLDVLLFRDDFAQAAVASVDLFQQAALAGNTQAPTSAVSKPDRLSLQLRLLEDAQRYLHKNLESTALSQVTQHTKCQQLLQVVTLQLQVLQFTKVAAGGSHLFGSEEQQATVAANVLLLYNFDHL